MKKMKQRQGPSLLYFSPREFMCLMFTDRRKISCKDLRSSTSLHSAAPSLCSALTLPSSPNPGSRGGEVTLTFSAFTPNSPLEPPPALFPNCWSLSDLWVCSQLEQGRGDGSPVTYTWVSWGRQTSWEGRGWNSPAQITPYHPLSPRGCCHLP